MQPHEVEQQGEAYLSALARERSLVAAGLKAELELGLLTSRFADLCSIETFQRVRDEPIDQPRNRAALDFLASCILQESVADLDAEIVAHELSSQIEWLGELVPLRTAQAVCHVEPDRDRRHRLDEAVRLELAGAERLAVERVQELRAAADRLEWSEPLATRAELRGIDLDTLSTVARSLLANTADQYEQALRDQLVHHHLEHGDAWEIDLDWILRGEEYDVVFASDSLMPVLFRASAGLGILLRDQPSVRLDLESRPLKQVAAACFPVAVPDEVHLVVRRLGGRADFRAVLGMVGEGESYAQVDRTQSLAHRRLGDGALRSAYGKLFGLLLLEPIWLQTYLETVAIRDPLRLGGLDVLVGLRRAAATFLYERELWRTPEPDESRELYADMLSDAIGVRVFPEHYLSAVEDPLASANGLRAWMLAGQLLTFLRAEFDEEWFRSSRAGRFLADLWRGGQRYTAEEMARHLGFEGLDASPLLAEATTAIGE